MTDLTKPPNKNRYYIHTDPHSHVKSYDVVVLATPLGHSKIKLVGIDEDQLKQRVPHIDYRTVHVTFIWGQLNKNYFRMSRKELSEIGNILTTNYHDVPFRSIGRFATDRESCTAHYSGCKHLYKFFAGHEMQSEIGGFHGPLPAS